MHQTNVTPIHSADLQQLQSLFLTLDKPCGISEIIRFNQLYRRVYPDLSRLEKRRAEDLVDALIADLEHPDLAPKIYGVV